MRPGARRATGLLAALVAVLAGGGAAFGADPSASTPASTSTPASLARDLSTMPVQVSIEEITPLVVRPGQDVQVTVAVHNAGTAPVAEPRVVVHLQRKGFISRSSLDTWRTADPSAALGTTMDSVDLAGPLAPGQSATVSVTVPASALGLPSAATAWGARGLGVELVDLATQDRERVGAARSFIVWYPSEVSTPTTLTVLVPVTGPAPGPGAAAQLAEDTATGGRLSDVVQATAASRAVTWALDPWVLDLAVRGPSQLDGAAARSLSAQSQHSDATSDPGEQPAAPEWGAQVIAAAPQHDVRLLPWADADVPALTHDGARDLLSASVERAVGTAGDLGLSTAGVVVLGGGEDPDRATAAVARSLDAPYVVSRGNLAPPSVLTYTPTSAAQVATADGTTTVLVPDERLSRLVETGSVLDPQDSASAAGSSSPTGATAAADLLAELAVITRERPSAGRHMLATLPRTWDPDVPVTRDALAALAQAPYVATAPLAQLADAPDAGSDRGELPTSVDGDGEVSKGLLDESAQAVDERVGLADMLADPATGLGDTQAEQLAVASRAWRTDAIGRRDLVVDSLARTDALRTGVEVAEIRDVNLLSSTGTLPLQIANHLDQAVHLTVRLAPSNARLVADKPVDVVIPAQGEVTAQLSVHGVQSADVPTTVQLLSPSGVLVNDSTTLLVRVRAEWEGIGTAVVGGLLALGFLAGLVRTIRRGRGRGRLGPGSVPPGAAGSDPPPSDPPPTGPAPADAAAVATHEQESTPAGSAP